MLFLVLGENIDPGYLQPPEQTMQTIEQAVVPSFQILGQYAKQGKLKGGTYAGERAGAFVIEAESFEDLDSIMNHLPFFGLVTWKVKPLLPFDTSAQQLGQYIRDFRQAMQSGS